MDKKISRKPIKLVMVRRGAITIPGVPTQKLQTFIRKRALLGTDEISEDGKTWIRVDRHYQLSKFFVNEGEEATVSPQEQGDVMEFSDTPPDFENNLKQVADQL